MAVGLLLLTSGTMLSMYAIEFLCPIQKMRYRVETGEEGAEMSNRRDYPSPPPSYNVSRRHSLAPPEYCDALQDVLLDPRDSREPTGENHSKK